jgi:hypothetical protein
LSGGCAIGVGVGAGLGLRTGASVALGDGTIVGEGAAVGEATHEAKQLAATRARVRDALLIRETLSA